MPWRKRQVLAIEIHPSPNRPHFLNRLGPTAGIFVRVGSTNRIADLSLIDEMRRYGQPLSFDEQPIPDLSPEALDFRVASELFGSTRKLTADALQTLRITALHQGKVVPTIGGFLLLGSNRFARFPDSWIQAGRFAGSDKRRILDFAEIRSCLPTAVKDAIGFLEKHMMREAHIGRLKRTEQWTLPTAAIREAVINAIVHADYAQTGAPIRLSLFDDRLEIENPGLLALGLTIEDIQRGISKLRNRVIGRVFQELGLIEQWGSGIQRMTLACMEQGLDAPKFEEIGTHFRVILSTKRRRAPAKDSRDEMILAFLDSHSEAGLSTTQIAKEVGISPRSARTRLASLVERGLVAEIGSGPQDPHRRYFPVIHEARTNPHN